MSTETEIHEQGLVGAKEEMQDAARSMLAALTQARIMLKREAVKGDLDVLLSLCESTSRRLLGDLEFVHTYDVVLGIGEENAADTIVKENLDDAPEPELNQFGELARTVAEAFARYLDEDRAFCLHRLVILAAGLMDTPTEVVWPLIQQQHDKYLEMLANGETDGVRH